MDLGFHWRFPSRARDLTDPGAETQAPAAAGRASDLSTDRVDNCVDTVGVSASFVTDKSICDSLIKKRAKRSIAAISMAYMTFSSSDANEVLQQLRLFEFGRVCA
jgi:hypothetical protein